MVRLFYTEVNDTGPFSKAKALHNAAHEMLRQCVLSCMTGLTGRSPHAVRLTLAYGPHGKPYLKSHPAFNISVSHAGNIALCAISESEIGADVQDHRPLPAERAVGIANRFFSPDERDALLRETDTDAQRALFFRLWAAKEAYVKYTGAGMAEDFSRFTADPDGMRIVSVPENGKEGRVLAFLSEPVRMPAYSFMICTGERTPPPEVIKSALDETFTAVSRF